MTPQEVGIVALVIIGIVVTAILPQIIRIENKAHWYEEGWQDCREAHYNFGMTPDDEIVLRHLLTALTAYIKANEYYQRGDIKKINEIKDFDELKHLVWEMCVRRKDGNQSR